TDPLINYTWSPATSLDNPAIPNPTATVVQDQTYTVTRSSPTCYVQDNVQVSKNTIDADFVHEYLPPCDGLRVKYFAGGNNYSSLSWDFGDMKSTVDTSSQANTNWFY